MRPTSSRSQDLRTRSSSVPRFSDPWCCQGRRRSNAYVADRLGRRVPTNPMRRGGVWLEVPADLETSMEENPEAAEPSRLAELRRRVAKTIARYRNEGRCTAAQLRMIELMWVDGIGLREMGRRDGVAPQAISWRIWSLRSRAPEFWNWWRLKNLNRAVRKRRT